MADRLSRCRLGGLPEILAGRSDHRLPALPRGSVPASPEGVWLMNADGTNRRRLCELGAPFWSPDGARVLVNGMLAHTISKIYDFKMTQYDRM